MFLEAVFYSILCPLLIFICPFENGCIILCATASVCMSISSKLLHFWRLIKLLQFLSSDAETWKGQCISYWVGVGNCPPPPPSWLQLPGFLSVNYFSTNKFSVKLHCNSNFRNISLDSGEVTLPFHLCFFKRKFLTVREDPFFDRFSCSGKQTGSHRFWFPLPKVIS